LTGENTVLLDIGAKAPDFELVSSNGETVRLRDLAEKNNIVLIFYPGDHTWGRKNQIRVVGDHNVTKIFGVNAADANFYRGFFKGHGFTFPLLIDEDHKMAKMYGCGGWSEIKRTVYAIDKHGTIVYAKSGMSPDDEILKEILGDDVPEMAMDSQLSFNSPHPRPLSVGT
jgi:peroxiredoxin Q/BCP